MFDRDQSKARWLSTYDEYIRKNARKQPDWQQWPAGHMYYAEGLAPHKAARLFLKTTMWGLKGSKRTRTRGRR